MREQPPSSGGGMSMVLMLLVASVSAFVLQGFFQNLFESNFISTHFALSQQNLSSFKIWTIVSYGFLHHNFAHILLNMLLVYFMGRQLEQLIGPNRLLALYLTGVVMGGLLWLFLDSYPGYTELVGASAGAMALLIYFCLLLPNQPITFLLFFVIPVTLKPKWIVWFLVITETMGTFLNFHPLTFMVSSNVGVAYSAHLGGIIAGFLVFFLHQGQLRGRMPSAGGIGGISVEPPAWLRKKRAKSTTQGKFKVNMVTRNEMESEVNRILDKINREGFGALTLEEKETLDRARDFLRR